MRYIKYKQENLLPKRANTALAFGAALLVSSLAYAQNDEEEEIFELSPFTVEGSDDQGYRATSTLAGTRIRTDLRDVGAAISVVTEEFLRDTGAVDNESLLVYTTSTETGGIGGNFAGNTGRGGFLRPQTNNRVRGLQSADATRDYFISDISWDGYNTGRVDLQRGPNSILSGLGSPAGIINNTTTGANFENEGKFQLRFGSYGSARMHFNVNRVVLEDELAIRFAGLNASNKYRQEEAFRDDSRGFVAIKYEPKFLKTDSATTSLTANYEKGKIDSNNPRTRPPGDAISGWWNSYTDANGNQFPSQIVGHPAGLNFNGGGPQLFDGTQLSDLVSGRNGASVPILAQSNVATNNPYIGSSYTDGPVLHFSNADKGDGNADYFTVPSVFSFDYHTLTLNADQDDIIRSTNGLQSTAVPFHRAVFTTTGLGAQAQRLGLPLAQYGGYGNVDLIDRSVFDYKNHLLDGKNKNEFQDFDVFNAKLTQTFFNNRFGIEAAIDRQSFTVGGEDPLGFTPSITLDVATHLADFSPNPNVGRPAVMVRTAFSGTENNIERDSYRITAFAELKEGDIFKSDTFMGRLVGNQRLTGLTSGDDIDNQQFGWKTWLADNRVRELAGVLDVTNNQSEVMAAIYLGPNLQGTDSLAGANLSPAPKLNPHSVNSLRFYDSRWADDSTRNVDYFQSDWTNTWVAPQMFNQTAYDTYVTALSDWDVADPDTRGNAPAVVWDGMGVPLNQRSTQGANAGNQIGWTNEPVQIYDPENNREQLVNSATGIQEEIRSEAFIWQGFFWDGAIVPTYGYRKDTQRSDNYTAPRSTDGRAVFFADRIFEGPPSNVGEEFEGTSESWSVVLHTDQFLPELPGKTRVSLFYNESSNFQPGQTRVDHLNQPLAPPTGETTDYGFMLSTLNDKVSLKVNIYENTVHGAGFNPGRLWYLGTAETSLFVVAMRDNAILTDIPGYNNPTQDYSNNPYQNGDGPWEAWKTKTGRGGDGLDQTVAEADAWQQRAVAAGLANVAPDIFWNAWGATQSEERWQSDWWDPWSESTGNVPSGFTSTSDLVSKGEEYELFLKPTENWDVAINASRTEATRDNIAGSLKEWVTARNLVHNGDAGDLRLWSSGDRNNTLATRWNSAFYSSYQRGLQSEGQTQAELREWRMNLVTNYNFRDGKLKGLSVGGSMRWEDEVGIGYSQFEKTDDGGNTLLGYDLDNPYLGPKETHVDLWAAYKLKLNDDIDWRIQLNVRDVLADGGLIPISVNSDGSVRTYRLEGDPNWFITNTFSF